jgi:hypothetical protein
MVLPDSHRIARVPWYLGTSQERKNFAYWTLTIYGPPFRMVLLVLPLITLRCFGRSTSEAPQPHTCNAYRLKHIWFRLFPVRSPLLGKSRLISSPKGTEMFQFPSFAFCTYEFSAQYRGFTPVGLPIRKSSDQSLFSDSPKLTAASHILHRLSIPRHSLYALSSLTHLY